MRILAVTVALSLLFGPALAQQQEIKLEPGQKVQIKGSTARISGGGGKGGAGLGGTWNCSCSGGAGTCEVASSNGVLVCRKSSGSGACSGTCSLGTTTTGAKAIQRK